MILILIFHVWQHALPVWNAGSVFSEQPGFLFLKQRFSNECKQRDDSPTARTFNTGPCQNFHTGIGVKNSAFHPEMLLNSGYPCAAGGPDYCTAISEFIYWRSYIENFKFHIHSNAHNNLIQVYLSRKQIIWMPYYSHGSFFSRPDKNDVPGGKAVKVRNGQALPAGGQKRRVCIHKLFFQLFIIWQPVSYFLAGAEVTFISRIQIYFPSILRNKDI